MPSIAVVEHPNTCFVVSFIGRSVDTDETSATGATATVAGGTPLCGRELGLASSCASLSDGFLPVEEARLGADKPFFAVPVEAPVTCPPKSLSAGILIIKDKKSLAWY